MSPPEAEALFTSMEHYFVHNLQLFS